MASRVALLLVLALLSASCLVLPFPVSAAPRTIVVEGDWMRIQGAVSSANSGDTILVKKGTYAEPTITIDRAITLIGEDANATVISNTNNPPWDGSFPPPPPTVAVQIAADKVKITGFTITGAIISIAGGGDGTQIVGNIIQSRVELNGNNQIIAGNKVTASFLCSGSHNNISANKVIGNHQGIIIEGSSNTVEDNILTGGGSLEVDGDNNSISENKINDAVLSIGGSSNVVFANKVAGNLAVAGNNNIFRGNYIQGVWMGNTRTDVVNNVFYHNNFNFVENSAIPEGEKTFVIWSGVHGPIFLDNGKEGNWWSDYDGNDTNGDGIGDEPYVIYANDTRNYHFVDDSAISNIILTDNFPLMFLWGPWDIDLSSPMNQSYSGGVPLVFFVDRSCSWLGYSIDGQDNVTVSGNTTLTGLAEGWHTVMVYANDTLGNAGTSATISFRVDTQTALFQTLLVAVAVVAAAVAASAGLLLYFKKRKAPSEVIKSK